MDHFTIHQLKLFGTVVEAGNITKAAERLHMTQPAASIQLKKLQQNIGTDLYYMNGKNLTLTDAGKEFYRVFLSVRDRLEAFEATLTDLKSGLRGKLSITAASTAKYVMPYLLGEFKDKYPEVDIALKITNRFEVIHQITQMDYNLAILSQVPHNTDLESTPFLRNPLVFACHPSHPLSGKQNINLRTLRDEVFIIREEGSGTRIVMEELLSKSDIHPRIGMELGTNEAVKHAIMAGIGISLVSELSLKSDLELGKISLLDVESLPVITYWNAIYKKSRRVHPLTEHFLSFLEQRKEFSTEPIP
ncbi:LysR family transcriptional regulator [Rhodohalobacter sp. 8-1]|uniref:LysR family transcriptional regulator n=1 Tax=Rhodohalobacter sp. 8-1 TaxID=3131972 RepID=UPI0030EC31E8